MKLIADLVISFIRDRKVPKNQEEGYIVNLYKGKGDALCRGNYRGLELFQDIMKVLGQNDEKQTGSITKIDYTQFGFMQGLGTTDAIFILRQLQEKYLKNKNRYFAFIDLEKAFDPYSCKETRSREMDHPASLSNVLQCKQ